MKLRNKRTGEVKEFNEIFLTKTVKETNTATSEYVERSYCKIAELNAEWEDYKPAEPLIKDEKIRKAVRAWSKANNINSNHYYNTDIEFDHAEHSLRWINTSIEFNEVTGLENLEDGKSYTIAELCGDDEK